MLFLTMYPEFLHHFRLNQHTLIFERDRKSRLNKIIVSKVIDIFLLIFGHEKCYKRISNRPLESEFDALAEYVCTTFH